VADEFSGACPLCLLKDAAGALAAGAKESSLPAGTRIGEFEILEPIGKGGMGSVYKARQVSLGRAVAIKILSPRHASSPDFIARFEREARLLAGLSHPNLVHVYGFGREGDLSYLAMEHVEGRALSFPVEAARLLRIVRDAALALQKVHDAGMVHRDVKPSNLLIAPDGTAKLGDFGIVVEPRKDDRLTETGVFVGSPHYASPEHIAGRALDGRSDLYALGVILFEGLAGHPPFSAPSSAAVLARHLHEPPPLGELDGKATPRLKALVERLLAKSPEGRPAKASEVAAELDQIAAQEPAAPRRRFLLGAGAAALAAVAAGSAWALRKPAPPVPAPRPLPPPPLDLLALVDPSVDTVHGKWTREADGLVVEAGVRAYRIQVPYEPPEEYDLRATVERLSGKQTFHLGILCSGRPCSVLLDAPVDTHAVSGLHVLDGKGGWENESTRVGHPLPPGHAARIEIRVRRAGVSVAADAKPLLDWSGDYVRLTPGPSFKMPNPAALWIGAEMDRFKIRSLEIVPLGSPGRRLRSP